LANNRELAEKGFKIRQLTDVFAPQLAARFVVQPAPDRPVAADMLTLLMRR